MKRNQWSIFCFFVVSCLLIQGCSSNLKQTESGFLEDYSQLKEIEGFSNTKVYKADKFNKNNLSRLKSIKLVPFEIWIDRKGTTSIDIGELAKLHQYFHTNLINKLKPYYEIVETEQEDSLTIRGAFSGIKSVEEGLSVSDFVPIRIVLNAGNSAYLAATDQKDIIVEVSVEAEFMLGTDPAQVFAMTATKQLDTTVADGQKGNFEAVSKVLDIWINNFVEKLIELKE